MTEMVLNTIGDGVIIISGDGIIQYINPAAVSMTGCANANEALGVNYLSILKFENGEGMEIKDAQNPLIMAVQKGEPFSTRNFVLVTMQGKKTPVALTLTPVGGLRNDKILSFRNIAKELEEEGEQTEFISTASHEMRTPVASIEGYLGLALNPQTATIDERARKYLTEAHNASQHLGKLFRDLLDVTKLDDKRVKVHLVPTDMNELVKKIADGHMAQVGEKKLKYSFGTPEESIGSHVIEQSVYASVDVDFLREILDNLIENAIKYTPSGGAIWCNVRGDGDRVLINVTDTGMGIAPDDLKHVFQKFYRADNSQTRTIGGTGLGLYIVKQRTEAMGGRVWAESSFGEGSTFYVSLPRLTPDEYVKQRQVMANVANMQLTPAPAASGQMGQTAMMAAIAAPQSAPAPTPTPQPAPTPTNEAPVQAPTNPAPAPQPAPVATPVATAPTSEAPAAAPTQASDMTPEKLAEMKAKFAAQAQAAGSGNG